MNPAVCQEPDKVDLKQIERALARLWQRLMPDVPAAVATEPAVGRPFDGTLFVYVGFQAAGADMRSGLRCFGFGIRHAAGILTGLSNEPYTVIEEIVKGRDSHALRCRE